MTPVLCWAVITQEFAKLTKAGLAELALICPTPTAVFFRQAKEGEEVRLRRCAYLRIERCRVHNSYFCTGSRVLCVANSDLMNAFQPPPYDSWNPVPPVLALGREISLPRLIALLEGYSQSQQLDLRQEQRLR